MVISTFSPSRSPSCGVLLLDLLNDFVLSFSSSFSFSISVKLSASARLSTAMAKKTFNKMSGREAVKDSAQFGKVPVSASGSMHPVLASIKYWLVSNESHWRNTLRSKFVRKALAVLVSAAFSFVLMHIMDFLQEYETLRRLEVTEHHSGF